MCDAFQREKGTKTVDHADPRFFLHLYFDVFIAEQVLELTIGEPFTAPLFNLHPSQGLTAVQAGWCAPHKAARHCPRLYLLFFASSSAGSSA